MAALGGEGAVPGACGSPGLGVDKINISLQTSIGVLNIEGASLDPPYISILESRKASDLNACYREGTVADFILDKVYIKVRQALYQV